MKISNIVFLLLPCLVKNFSFSLEWQKENKIKVIEFDLVVIKEIIENDIEKKLSWNEIVKDDCLKKAKEENKENENSICFKFNKILFVIKKPSSLPIISEWVDKEENTKNLAKSLILINISQYKIIEEIQRQYWFCFFCQKLHKKEEGAFESDSYFCSETQQSVLNKNESDRFNTESINSYLGEAQETVNQLITKTKLFRKEQVVINSLEELVEGTFFNNLLKNILNM